MKFLVFYSCLFLSLLTGCGGGGDESTPNGGGSGSGGKDITYNRFPIEFPYSTSTPHALKQESLFGVSKNLVQLNDALAVLAFTGDVSRLQTYSMPLQPTTADTVCTTGNVVVEVGKNAANSEFISCAIAGIVIDGRVRLKNATTPEASYQVTITHPETQQKYSLTGYMLLMSNNNLVATGTISSATMPTIYYENLTLGLMHVAQYQRYWPWLQSGNITIADQGTLSIRAHKPATAVLPDHLAQVEIIPFNAMYFGEKGILQQWFVDGSIRLVNSSSLLYSFPVSLIYQAPSINQAPTPQLDIVSEVMAENQPFQISQFNSSDADGDALTFDLQIEPLVPGGEVSFTPNATGYSVLATMSGEYLATLTVTDQHGAQAVLKKSLIVRYSKENGNHAIEPYLQLTNLKAFEYPLRVAKGKQAELVNAPAGMTIQNNVLHWLPQIPALGGKVTLYVTIKIPGVELYENSRLEVATPVASQQTFVRDFGYESGSLLPLPGGRADEFIYMSQGQPSAVLSFKDQQISVQGLPVIVPAQVSDAKWMRKTSNGFEFLTFNGPPRWVNLESEDEHPLPISTSDMYSMTFDYDHDGHYESLVQSSGKHLKVLTYAGDVLWNGEQSSVGNTVKSFVGHCDLDKDGFEDVVYQNTADAYEIVSLKKQQRLGLVNNNLYVIEASSSRCYLLETKSGEVQGIYSFKDNDLTYTAFSGPKTLVTLPLQKGRFIDDFELGVMVSVPDSEIPFRSVAAILGIKDNQLSLIKVGAHHTNIGIADLNQDGKDEVIRVIGLKLEGSRYINQMWKAMYHSTFQPSEVPTYQTADTQLWMSSYQVRYQQQWYHARDPSLPKNIRDLHNLVYRELTSLSEGEFRFDDVDGKLMWQTKPTFSQPDLTGYTHIKTSEIAVVLAGNGEAAVLNMRTGAQMYRVEGGPAEHWNSVKLFRLQKGLHLLWAYSHDQILLLTESGYSWLSVPELQNFFRWTPILAKIDQGYLAGTRLLLGEERPMDAFETSLPGSEKWQCDPLRFNCSGNLEYGKEQDIPDPFSQILPDIWPRGTAVGVRQLDGSYVTIVTTGPLFHILEPAKP